MDSYTIGDTVAMENFTGDIELGTITQMIEDGFYSIHLTDGQTRNNVTTDKIRTMTRKEKKLFNKQSGNVEDDKKAAKKRKKAEKKERKEAKKKKKKDDKRKERKDARKKTQEARKQKINDRNTENDAGNSATKGEVAQVDATNEDEGGEGEGEEEEDKREENGEQEEEDIMEDDEDGGSGDAGEDTNNARQSTQAAPTEEDQENVVVENPEEATADDEIATEEKQDVDLDLDVANPTQVAASAMQEVLEKPQDKKGKKLQKEKRQRKQHFKQEEDQYKKYLLSQQLQQEKHDQEKAQLKRDIAQERVEQKRREEIKTMKADIERQRMQHEMDTLRQKQLQQMKKLQQAEAAAAKATATAAVAHKKTRASKPRPSITKSTTTTTKHKKIVDSSSSDDDNNDDDDTSSDDDDMFDEEEDQVRKAEGVTPLDYLDAASKYDPQLAPFIGVQNRSDQLLPPALQMSRSSMNDELKQHGTTIRDIRSMLLNSEKMKGSEKRFQKAVRDLHRSMRRADVGNDAWLPSAVVVGTLTNALGLTKEDGQRLVDAVAAGYETKSSFHQDQSNWIKVVDSLRLMPLPEDVCEWKPRHVMRWMATYLHMNRLDDGRLLRQFKRCHGEALLMIPLHERLHQVKRAEWKGGADEENHVQDDGKNITKKKKKKEMTPAERRARSTKVTKVAGSYLERQYDMKNGLHRKKLLLEIKSLASRRRGKRRTLSGAFDVTKWKQVDVLDWLHYDVKLPMYTDHFLEAQLDGRTLRDGLTSLILKSDMFIEQKRHRRKIMGCIQTLRKGAPLTSPTYRREPENGGLGGSVMGGMGGGLRQMDGIGSNFMNSAGGMGVHGTTDDDENEENVEEEETAVREEYDLRQNAILLQNIRKQVEAELKGISHGEQLLDMSGADVDSTAWEFGLESPTAKSLRLGKNPNLPSGPDEVDVIASQSKGEETYGGARNGEDEDGIPTLHLNDSGKRGPPFVVPRHSQVSEMISVIHVLSKNQYSHLIDSRLPSLSSLPAVLWTRMLGNMDQDTAKREGGITFQEFPTTLFGTLNLSIRNQMQVLLLFRAMDVDGDGVISRDDCKKAFPIDPTMATGRSTIRTARSNLSQGGPASPTTSAAVMKQDVLLADSYLNAVADNLDEKKVTVKNMFMSVVRQAGRGGTSSSAKVMGAAFITRDEFVAFIAGWVPKHLSDKMRANDAIVDCVMDKVDCNVDDRIGWDEFQSSFVTAGGRRLLRLRMEAERLQESRLPSLLPRYKSTINKIGKCQVSIATLYLFFLSFI